MSRNTVMDRAGQCFGTPLGQAVFDNSDCAEDDCAEDDVRLNPLEAEIVQMARATEVWADCSTENEARQLDGGAQLFRDRLTELFTVPVRADSEHGCVCYRDMTIPLDHSWHG